MSGEEHYFGAPADPSTKECDWCDRTPVCAYEIFKSQAQVKRGVGTAQYLYACRKHRRLAKEQSMAPRAAA